MNARAGMTVRYPAFFDAVERIVLYDPLAEFLGAADRGNIEYGYLDAVKLAGHSCPTVAGAYLMALKALKALYPRTVPERGSIRVQFNEAIDHGVTGVVASVVGLITGAAQQNGFKGIAGRFDRRNLLFFDAAIEAGVRFARVDSGVAAIARFQAERVPSSPRLKALMAKLGTSSLSAAERSELGLEWQARVKQILIDEANNPELVAVELEQSQRPEA